MRRSIREFGRLHVAPRASILNPRSLRQMLPSNVIEHVLIAVILEQDSQYEGSDVETSQKNLSMCIELVLLLC